MKFVTIDAETFRAYASKSPYQSFMQTPEIAALRAQDGWMPHYLALKSGDQIKAATMLVSKPTFLGKSVFIAPGGPLLDFSDTKLANEFLAHLKSYAKEHGGYVLQISPYYELIQRDRHGIPVENGFDHSSAIKTLRQLGFREVAHASQPKYMFALELQGHTEAELFSDMKRNTRNHIRKAEKAGVTVRELKREELDILKQITESTSVRRGFTDRPLSYYESMYDLFAPRHEVKFLLAEVDSTPLSAAMFMLTGHEVVYLFSGSDEKYMKEYNAQYLVQWEIIKFAASHNYKTYNFYGIHSLPTPDTQDGIYDFKKGFTSEQTGRVIELIGTYEAPLSPLIYRLHHALSKIKH